MNEKDAKIYIEKLKDGECLVWAESDYRKAEIWLKNGCYFLFFIPLCGGEPVLHKVYCGKGDIGSLIAEIENAT